MTKHQRLTAATRSKVARRNALAREHGKPLGPPEDYAGRLTRKQRRLTDEQLTDDARRRAAA